MELTHISFKPSQNNWKQNSLQHASLCQNKIKIKNLIKQTPHWFNYSSKTNQPELNSHFPWLAYSHHFPTSPPVSRSSSVPFIGWSTLDCSSLVCPRFPLSSGPDSCADPNFAGRSLTRSLFHVFFCSQPHTPLLQIIQKSCFVFLHISSTPTWCVCVCVSGVFPSLPISGPVR